MRPPSRAFVTGGSGFIGSRLVARLVREGWRVRALARTPVAARRVTEQGATTVSGDLDDRAALQAGMEGCDVVFHLAAKIDDWGPAEEYRRTHVEGTRNVLDAAHDAGVRRLVHVSTEAVLLSGDPLVDVNETHPYPAKTLGRYGSTKREAEQLVVAANTASLTTVVVRPRLVYGGPEGSLERQFAAAVRSGRFRWIGDGNQLTSVTHVDNVVEGLLLAVGRGKGGEIYFVTDGPPVTLRSIVQRMLAAQGLEPPERRISPTLAGAMAAICEALWSILPLRGSPPVTRTAVAVLGQTCTIDDSKARRELGYRGATPAAGGEIGQRPQTA